MSEIVFVQKSKSETYSTDYILKTFNNSNDLGDIKDCVEKAEERIYVTWASVDAIDKSNERIPIEDIIKQQDKLLERGAPISADHTNAIVGKTLAYKVMLHPETKTLGVLHLNKIFNDNDKDTEVWKEIVSGKRIGSSVGGIKTSTSFEVKNDGSFTKILNGFQQYETASTDSPCNPYALNEAVSIVAKSEEKKMEKKEIMKEGEEDMNPETPQIDVAELAQAVQAILERLDMLEEAVSGKPEDVAEEEMPEEEKPEEEEKAEDSSEEDLPAEKPSEEDKETKKELEELKKELSDLKKKFNAKVVVKADRVPAAKVEEVKKEEVKKTPYQLMVEKRESIAKRYQ